MTTRVSLENHSPTFDSETTLEDARERRRAIALVLVCALAVLWVVCWFAPRARLDAELAISTGRMPALAACTAVLLGLGLLSFAMTAFGLFALRCARSVAAPKQAESSGDSVETLGRIQAFLGTCLVVLATLLFVLVLYGLAMLSLL